MPGDGTVAFMQDNDSALNGSVPAYDKEWITAGPRPAGVSPTCFTPLTHAVTACNTHYVGTDRLYVTYSLFSAERVARDLPQLLGRPGTVVVAAAVHRGLGRLLRSELAPERPLPGQPGLAADGQPDHRPALGRLHER